MVVREVNVTMRNKLPCQSCHKPETSELNIGHLKVTLIISVNRNDQSNFQMTNVQFARLRFVGSLGWQKSTALRLR